MKWLVTACTLVTLFLVPGTAHGDRKSAERYFRAGEKAYRVQNYDAAAANFDRAYEAFPAPEIAFSAAQAHRRQYHVETDAAAAIEHAKRAVALYNAYLAKVKKGGRVGDAVDNKEQMQRELDRRGVKPEGTATAVQAAPKRTLLGVTVVFADQSVSSALQEIDEEASNMPQVTTTIDGKPVPPDELVEVEPGEHVVRAEAAGYLPAERKVKVIKDTEDFENLELAPRPALVTIETDAGARIVVDGRYAGTAPAAAIELAAGTHVVSVSRRGRRPVSREVTVARGEQHALAIDLEPTARRRVVPWVFGAAGVLGVFTLASTVPWLVYQNRAEDLDEQLQRGDADARVATDYNKAIDRRDLARNAIWLGAGATVVVTCIAFALYYFDTPSAEATRVTPVVTAGGAGAVISGHF